MRSFLQATLKVLCSFLIGIVFTFFVFESVFKSEKLSEASEISADSNITQTERGITQQAILRSRLSAVQIMSASESTPIVSSSSGTYFKYKNRYYILTVAHVIMGPCDSLRIMVHQDMYECKKFVTVDRIVDYAIIEVDKLWNRTPVILFRNTPRNSGWDEALSIQTGVYYTGFPNGLGPLTIDGRIVGYDNSENTYIHSFAWPGSSGSGVFNDRGEFIGFVMAISVGVTEFGVTVLEDVAIMVPLYQIDWNVLEQGEE